MAISKINGTGTSNIFTSPTLIDFPSISTNVFYLSSVLGRGDANLANGSTDYGTLGDVGPQIQAILDQATNGPIKVVFDGAYSVGRSLKLRSFTELNGVGMGGLILRSNVNSSLLTNASWGKNTSRETNISFTGSLVLNGGGRDAAGNTLQTHSSITNNWTSTVSMHGLQNPYFGPDVEIRNPRTFGVLLGRVNGGEFHSAINVGNNPSANQDGYHLVGPSTNNLFSDMTIVAYDDGIAINANDGGTNCTSCANGFGVLGYAGWNGGPITGTRIKNIYFDRSNYGVRLLSSSEWLTDVDIDGLFGTTYAHAILIDNYAEDPPDLNATGQGNFGSIYIRNVQTKILYLNYWPATIYVNGHGNQLTIEGGGTDYIHQGALVPYLFANTNSYWRQMSLRNVSMITATDNQLFFDDLVIVGGHVDQLTLSGLKFNRTNMFRLYPINISANVGSMVLDDIQAYGFDTLGSWIYSAVGNTITNTFIKNTYVYPGISTDTYATNISTGVWRFAAGQGVRTLQKYAGNEGNDVTVSADFFIEGAAGTNSDFIIAARSQNGAPWSSATTRRNIAFGVNASTTMGSSANLTVKNGDATDVILSSISSISETFSSNGWYRAELSTWDEGGVVRIASKLIRLSDGAYMQTNGAWSSVPVEFLTATASGTNYWKTPVPEIAFGYYSLFSTNGSCLISNVAVNPFTGFNPSPANLAGPRINIGGGAASEPAYVATAESIVVKGAEGDRTAVLMKSPTNNVGVILQAVGDTAVGPLGAGYVGSSGLTPFRLVVGVNYAMELDTNGVPNTSKLRILGAGNQLEMVDRAASAITNVTFVSNGAQYSVATPPGFTNFYLNLTNGNIIFAGSVTAGNGFVGNGSGLTNLPATALQGAGGAGTPNTNGVSGQVLTSAGNGGVYWAASGSFTDGAGLTNLIGSSTASGGWGTAVLLTKNANGSTNYQVIATNALTSIATNSTAVALDFTSGTPRYRMEQIYASLAVNPTNIVDGREIILRVNNTSGATRTVTINTNGWGGAIYWNAFPARAANVVNLTNNSVLEISFTASGAAVLPVGGLLQ